MIILNKKQRRLSSFFYYHDRVFLYGCGNNSEEVLTALEGMNDCKVEGCFVSPGHFIPDDFHGIKVSEFNAKVIKDTDGIIVTMADYKDTLKLLCDSGVNGNQIFLWDLGIRPCPIENYNYCNMLPAGKFFADYRDLDDIGIENGTDKSSRFHNYLTKYGFFLDKWKNKSFVLWEFGVLKGESLYTWNDYFKDAKIIGIDINEECKQVEKDNCSVYICDLSKKVEVNNMKKTLPKPSIIIDDASHRSSDQINSLITFFPLLESGGIYIVEDLSTSFGENLETFYDDSVISGFDFCNAICEAFVSKMEIGNNCRWLLMENEIRNIIKDLDMISFIQGSCILIKR